MSIEKYKLPTKEEILNQYMKYGSEDPCGFEWHQYVPYLDFELVRNTLKEGFTEEEFNKDFKKELKRESIIDEIKDYMGFAFDKANNCRGISSNRSIGHYIAWIFLAGDKGFSDEIRKEFKENYCYYGKQILKKICEFYKIDYSTLDDGVLTNG